MSSNNNKASLSTHSWIMAVVLLLMAGNASSTLLDDIKADLLLNEAPLLNAPTYAGWAKNGTIVMGNAPRGDATPIWWTPANTSYKSSTPWTTITPWFVIYPGASNKATNVRVKLYGMTLYVLRKSTHTWVKINTGPGNPTWAINTNFATSSPVTLGPINVRTEPDGRLSYKLNASSNPIHGGMSKYDMTLSGINLSDISAVFASMKTQLILDNPAGIDDRASAQILASVGADYYPTITTQTSAFAPSSYNPGIGQSRYGIVKTVPRTHYLATIDPPGSNTGGSAYLLNGGQVVMPADQFGANMPPYLFDTIAPSAPTALQAALLKQPWNTYATNTLSWQASSDNIAVAGYNIYRNGVRIGGTTATTFKDVLNTATGTLYTYTVKAIDDAGNLSAASNQVQTVF